MHRGRNSLVAALLPLVAALALAAAPASAESPTATMGTVSAVSYASAHVTGEVAGKPPSTVTTFQYSTDDENWVNGPSEFTFGGVTKPVEATITGLKGGTRYYVRLTATNFIDPVGISPGPDPEFTTLPVDPPTIVALDDAGGVEYTRATLSGEVSRPANPDHAFDATCTFEYVTDEAFGSTGFEGAAQAGCSENPVEKAGTSEVGAELSGLTPATKYHLRLTVSNAGGSDEKVAASTFTTLGPVPAPTVVAVENASEVQYRTAKVGGEVLRPAGADSTLDATCTFEYVTDEAFGSTGFEGAAQVGCAGENPIHVAGPSKVSAELGGLEPGTKYHLRLSASNSGGSDSKTAAATFTTLAPVPAASIVKVEPASKVGYSLATLSAEINRPAGSDSALDVGCTFEFISDSNYADSTEVDKLTIQGTGGTFVLSFEGVETGPIAFNASAATVGAALEALSGIGAGNVSVSGGPGNKDGSSPYLITFAGSLVDKNLPEIGQNGSGLTGPTISAGVETITQGHSEGFEGANQAGCNPENPVHKDGTSKVEATIGLLPGTEYHQRLSISNGGGSDVEAGPDFTTVGPQPLPTPTLSSISAVTGATAHVSGSVNPNGVEPSFQGEWIIQCTPGCGQPQGQFFYGELDGQPKPVEADLIGLQPNTSYQVKLTAYNFIGGTADSAPLTFKTPQIAPSVSTGFASEIKKRSATLEGEVNPHNSAVTYQFEWGLDDNYGNVIPIPAQQLAGVDNFVHAVRATLTGLEESTTYHFRLTATTLDTGNASHGADHSFTTPPAATCPNEQIRLETSSLDLPECRGYEMVSPIKKSGNDAGYPLGGAGAGPGYSWITADGDGIVYHTRGTVGEDASSGIEFYIRGRRGATGWSAASALPKGNQPVVSVLTNYPNMLLFSPDLTKVFWVAEGSWITEVPLSPFLGGTSAAYRGGTAASDPVEWLSRPQIPDQKPGFGELNGAPIVVGGSPDLDTAYFWWYPTLLPGDETRAENHGWGLYEYSDGELKHADTLPDGSQPAGGSMPANTINGPFGRNPESNMAEVTRGAVTPDGSGLFFVSPDPQSGLGPPELYLHRGEDSVLVSRTADGKPAPSGASATQGTGVVYGGAQYVFGTPDGKTAFFQSQDALTADAPNDSAVKSYRYDIAANTITYLPGVGKVTIVASSDDGSRFLFEAGRIALWDHGTIKVVADAGRNLVPARSTASGSVFVFAAEGIEGFHSGVQFYSHIYRYDVALEQLSCVSCPPAEVTPTGGARVGPIEAGGMNTLPIMSPDGDKVFFQSPDPFVPQDKNERADVYVWTPNGISLISTGRNSFDSLLVGSDRAGNNVFFSTKANIAPEDDDGLYDIYDARVNGGFKQKPAVIPCSGVDLCHGAPQEPPAQSGGGSNQFVIKPTPKFRATPGGLVDGKLRLTIVAPVAATVSASGKGLRSTVHTNAKPASFKLSIPLKPAIKKALRKKHELALRIHLHYSPDSGTPSSADVALNVRG